MMPQLTGAHEALRALEHLYALEGEPELQQFLETAPFLTPLLQEAHGVIHGYFPQAALFLKVIPDPEVPGDTRLVAAIAPTCPPDEAVAKFTQFLDTWWLDSEEQAQGQLAIVLEYR